ncbi:NPC intracellular cholesterol transporter 2-like isoform X1 [Haliotis rufescens]|uniref:NPC intracellular cholesterol transporter 2-like isoform X1 n=1 Tax=Haliotis rufescens TaxID=6454 RepID=UPI001EB074C0|nr:NPC intracellular cholesterol transporter 2-like isoform X1 [Haliotis rufescens]
MIRIFLLSVAVYAAIAEEVKDFKDCGSVSGKINTLDITPCPSFPCQFPKGKNVTVSITMTANAKLTEAKTVVHGIIDGVNTPFPISQPDACQDMTCPVNSGSEVTYTNSIFVREVFPKIRLVVKWEIQDQSGKDFICFEVPAEITD